jgi:putative radical SAM enzyme (TIGR03279 family)
MRRIQVNGIVADAIIYFYTMKACKRSGLMIKSLPRDGLLFASGLRPRDSILFVNGFNIIDELDFFYRCADDFLEIEIERGGRLGAVEIDRPQGVSLDVEFFEKPVNRCANKCIFCFIDQMPRGLRRSLYVKDEDFKHSFLNGNYVTLASASLEDLARVASIGLSPLYVSVHATAPGVRAALLGNRRAPDIRAQLASLSGAGVAFHTQIVVCPGINDGAVLDDTARDLFEYGDSLLSIAVVPVGITKFRKRPLAPVDKACAIDICRRMGGLSDRMTPADGARKLFLADELFIKAGLPIPAASYYGDYPQIENGVGLVRRMLSEGERLKRRLRARSVDTVYANGKVQKKNSLVLTGYSARPFLQKALRGIAPYAGKNFDVHAVTNHYFGESVTVAGLLTAADVIRKAKSLLADAPYDEIILPKAMFNHAGHTLDGYSLSRIRKSVQLPVKTAGTVNDALY